MIESIFLFIVAIVEIYLGGGLLGAIGGYVAYRRDGFSRDFWALFEKPFLILGGIYVVFYFLSEFTGTTFFVTAGFFVAIFGGYSLVREEVF